MQIKTSIQRWQQGNIGVNELVWVVLVISLLKEHNGAKFAYESC